MNKDRKEFLLWCFLGGVICAMVLLAEPYLPKPENEIIQRTVILQDGTKIKTTLFQIRQWTLQTGVSIGQNDYAGNYTVLIGHVE